jgi:hypothetical protein
MGSRLHRDEVRPLSPIAGTLKSHCTHGHEFTAANTYVTKRGWRDCRACQRDRIRTRREDPEFRARKLAYLTPERRLSKQQQVYERCSSDPEFRERLRVGSAGAQAPATSEGSRFARRCFSSEPI